MHQVDAGPGAVVLAHGVDARWVGPAAHIFLDGLRRIVDGRVWAPLKAVTDEVVGIRADHPLRVVVGLNQEEPVVRGGGHGLVDHLEHAMSGDDVHGGELEHSLGVILGQAVRDTSPAIVAC